MKLELEKHVCIVLVYLYYSMYIFMYIIRNLYIHTYIYMYIPTQYTVAILQPKPVRVMRTGRLTGIRNTYQCA